MPYVKAVNKVLVVGTVSNIARNLDRDIHRVLKALSSLDVVGIYLVESDSVDETISILSHLSQEIPFFNFVSLGTLRGIIPERISRIRYCRNIYVNYIRAFKANHEIDFVVIADLDGMNTAISRRGIDSTFIREGWGAVLANQTGGYYDLLALRHPNWCPGDVMEELKNLQEVIVERGVTKASLISKFRRRMDFDKARKISIYSKMKIFPRNSQWIEVESGFGGFGIYRAEIFSKFDYSLFPGDESFASEHVALSARIRGAGFKIFINPNMINNKWNTYNINRFFLIRQVRQAFWNSKLRSRLIRR